jgi:heavy metal sensor kinase
LTRIPIRLRLTLAFALAMAIVLAAVGGLLYLRLGDSLEEQVDDGLDARAQALTALTQESGGSVDGSDLASGDDEGFGQVLRADGLLVASSPVAGDSALLSEEELARAQGGSFFLRDDGVPGLGGEPARLLVAPVDAGGETLILVVGASLEDREEALEGLLTQLFIVGPVALLLASLAGYLLAGAALRPVEAMRRQAAAISTEQLARRLPLPGSRDELQRLGETLNSMLDRLEVGLRRERRFVADASHELRTPLALLQTELELALRRPRSNEELEGALRSAAEDVDRLTRLAEDLLVLAQADEGRLPLRRSPIAVEELLGSVERRFAARATGEGRALRTTASVGTTIIGDRLRLEQALGNLVDNALRYGAGTVQVAAEWDDGHVVLTVSDEGAGFPADFLPRAFERFAQADDARGGSESGLGLAIVEAIAEAHGGSARAENRNGGGTSVSLLLPVDRGD